jgi:hypothetical protein
LDITIITPVFTVEGAADDTDPTNGPGLRYGPVNRQADSVTDGSSLADSVCTSAIKLKVEATGQTTRHSTSHAQASAKASATSTLVISYSLLERILRWFGIWQALNMQVAANLQATVDNGPCGGGFTVFILKGPGGLNPVPSWQGLYSVSQNASDTTKLDVKRPNDLVEVIPNGGRYTDWPDGPTVPISPGRYDLTFENSVYASADGIVSIVQECELVLYQN